MGGWNFNRNECIRALKKLGFVYKNSRHGHHDKFLSPIPGAVPPFIMIPRHRVLHCQNAVVKELRKMGGEEMVEKFKANL